MTDILILLAVAFASALLPVINLEAYLSLRAALADGSDVWMLGLVAALGQIVGKLVWYWIGASSLEWAWVKRKLGRPKQRAFLERWRSRTDERPVVAGAVVFVSAFSSVPPFALLSVVAGQLRMNLVLFVVLGVLGRWLRFAALLGSVEWLKGTGLV